MQDPAARYRPGVSARAPGGRGGGSRRGAREPEGARGERATTPSATRTRFRRVDVAMSPLPPADRHCCAESNYPGTTPDCQVLVRGPGAAGVGTPAALHSHVVGLPGFEPGTSASRTQRANQTAPQPVASTAAVAAAGDLETLPDGGAVGSPASAGVPRPRRSGRRSAGPPPWRCGACPSRRPGAPSRRRRWVSPSSGMWPKASNR